MTEKSQRKCGRCFMMCPLKEITLREREGLLHQFEIDESFQTKQPRADASKVVKCFNRSAAGRHMPELDELRPGIAIRKDCDWVIVYDFIFDRLRAIRQDVVIQQLDLKTSICIYEQIVKFLVYSAQRLCERGIYEYDPEMNMKHLIECTESLINLYDEYEKNPVKVDLDISENTEAIVYSYNRSEMETLYILLRLGQTNGLKRGLSLPVNLRRDKNVQAALKISLAWFLRDYILTCRLIQIFSPLLQCAILCNLQNIRREALLIMSTGYSSKNLSFPGLKLKEILLYKSIDKVKQDCELFNLTFKDDKIYFQRQSFKVAVKMATPERIFSEDELNSFLPIILIT